MNSTFCDYYYSFFFKLFVIFNVSLLCFVCAACNLFVTVYNFHSYRFVNRKKNINNDLVTRLCNNSDSNFISVLSPAAVFIFFFYVCVNCVRLLNFHSLSLGKQHCLTANNRHTSKIYIYGGFIRFAFLSFFSRVTRHRLRVSVRV